ncbi:hypothetical protein INR49_004919 [Caranx melampygus]|nr:hypothetical protein INR49_004919 [Caranx melampygus]
MKSSVSGLSVWLGSVRLGSVRIGVGWSGLSALVLVRMEPQFAEQDQKICRTEATPLLCGRIQTVFLMMMMV